MKACFRDLYFPEATMCKKQLLTSHHEKKKVKLYHKSVFSNLFSCPLLLLCRAAVPKSLFFVTEHFKSKTFQLTGKKGLLKTTPPTILYFPLRCTCKCVVRSCSALCFISATIPPLAVYFLPRYSTLSIKSDPELNP